MRRAFCLAAGILCFLAALAISLDLLIQRIPHVTLEEAPAVDYGTLDSQEQAVFDAILAAAEAGEDAVPCPELPAESQREIITHLGLYFGSMEGVSGLVTWWDGCAALDPALFEQFAAEKEIIDARIDEAVSGLIDGSDRWLLWQISNYIAARVAYTDGVRDTLDGLNGKGVCATYAMIFYKMASRLGIQTYLCYGYTGDVYHCWNAVELDGELYYYDITWYDSAVHDLRWLHRRESWGRDCVMNRL